MNTRKIVLLSLIGILAAVYAGQLVLSGRNQVRQLSLDVEADTIVIENTYGTVTLTRKNEKWTVSGSARSGGSAAVSADAQAADTVLRTVGTLHVLGTVSPDGGGRYGFADGKGISVTLLKDGLPVRALMVGKTSVTARQTYVQLDGKKDVLLISGDIPALLNKSADDFRSREVYSVPAADISSVTVTFGALAAESGVQSYVLEKAGEPPRWQLVPEDTRTALDAEKTASWINSLASLNAVSWAPDDFSVPDTEKAAGSVMLRTVSSDSTRAVRVTVFGKDENGNYLCTSDAVPYAFYLSSYAAEKYLKPFSALTAN